MSAQITNITQYLETLGITNPSEIVHNPSYERLFEEESSTELEGYERCYLSNSGAMNVFTGEYTGRSPKDKYIVKDDLTRDTLWWNENGVKNDNKAITQEVWSDLKSTVSNRLSEQKLYIVDAFCGANPSSALKVRFIMEVALSLIHI